MNTNLIKNEKLTIKNMKTIAKTLVTEEEKINNFKIELYPLTTIEWYHKNFKEKKFKLQNFAVNFEILTSPLLDFGFTTPNKKIFIFLNSCQSLKLLTPKHALTEYIFTIYHELGHNYQRQCYRNYNKEQMFTMIIDDYINLYSPNHYKKYYNSYFEEIDANLYAINKTKKLFENHPHLYHKHKEYIENLNEQFIYEYENFNLTSFFEMFHQIYSENPIEYKIHHNFTDVFYKKDNNKFNTIEEIINHKDFNFYNNNIFTTIITSKPYLNSLNYNTMSPKELNILSHELTKAINIDTLKQKRTISYQQKNKNIIYQIKLLKELTTITKRINYLNNYLNNLNELIYQKNSHKK